MTASEQWYSDKNRQASRLRTIAADVLQMEDTEIGMWKNLYDDLGATSLEKAEIVARVEREYGMTLTDRSIATVHSLDDISAVLGEASGVHR